MGIRIPSMSVSQVRQLSNVRHQAALNASATPDNQSKVIQSTSLARESAEYFIKPMANLPDVGLVASPGGPVKLAMEVNSARQATVTNKPKANPARTGVSTSHRDVVRSVPAGRKLEKPYTHKIQVFVSAPFPAPGSSSTFEIASRHYPPHKALQMIMRRALKDYDNIVEKGSFEALPQIYATDPTADGHFVTTSRMMPIELQRIARAHFDPLGLESTRSFGRKLATAALAAFFAYEINR